MIKTECQKLKLLYIKQFLEEMTDENHSVSANDIILMLRARGISAERKSVYTDIDVLKTAGFDIIVEHGRYGGVRMVSRPFELAELKIIIDAVQASRFITVKKSKNIIKKLENFTSVYEKDELNRGVFITNRIKSENESILYNTDCVHTAINRDRQISFKYFTHGIKRKNYQNSGKYITVSPYAMIYDSDTYYLVAFDAHDGVVKHYRVDRMEKARVEDVARAGKELFENFDSAEYAGKMIKMFSGNACEVTLACKSDYAEMIIDKFGKNHSFTSIGNDIYTTNVDVALSPAFYAWVFTFSGKIKIVSPQKAVDEYRRQIKDALESFDD